MIWTLLAFFVTLLILRKFAFPRDLRGAGQARQRAIEESIETAERTQDGGRGAARGVPRAAQGGAHAGRRHRRCAPARPARSHEREAHGPGPYAARGAARADPPRHRGRDPPRDPEIRARGRRPHGRRDREGHPPRSDGRRPAAPRRRGAGRARLLGPAARSAGTSHGGDRPGLRAVALRGRQGAGQARRRPRAARPVRRRAGGEPRAAALLLLAVLLDARRRSDGLRRAVDGRRSGDRELPRAPASRTTGCRSSSASAPRVRAAAGERPTSSCRSPSRARSRSTTPSSSASATRSAARPAAASSSPATVDPAILGGIVLRVGNSILDASIRNRLENLRKQVARA